jgi:hypothetical protein
VANSTMQADAMIIRIGIAVAAAVLLFVLGLSIPTDDDHKAVTASSRPPAASGDSQSAKRLEQVRWAREPVRDPNAPSWVWRSHYRLAGTTTPEVGGFVRP